MKARMIVFATLYCMILSVHVFALEMRDGRIKVVLHEDTGRFSLFYLSNVEKNEYIPLFVTQDPRTTSFSVLFGTKVFRMGESAQFTQTVIQSSGSIGYEWKSTQFSVKEEISFISSGASVLSDGIAIKITVTNTSESEKPIAVRYLFDTYLGESKRTHFKTDIQTKINTETALPGNSISYIISQDQTADSSEGFQIMTKAQGATNPEKAILANWKRLNDSSWLFDVSNGREFNLLPYSVNDSAVMLFYPSENIARNATREVTILMGFASMKGFTARKHSETSLAGIFDSAVINELPVNADPAEVKRLEILSIDNFILQIDRKIDSGEPITDEEMAVFRRILEELKKRKK